MRIAKALALLGCLVPAALFAQNYPTKPVTMVIPFAAGGPTDTLGRNLGVAFQLVDDALDYDSNAAAMGKDRGDDFREGKMTLPVILAYARGSDDDRAFWKEAVLGRRNGDDDFTHAQGLVRSSRAVDDTLARARHYGQRAIDALGIFPASAAKDAMIEAVEFAVARAY